MNTDNLTGIKRYSDQNKISPDNTKLTPKIDKYLFTGFETVLLNKQLSGLIHCPITANGNYKVPESVTSIGIEAFSQCKGLTSILFPTSLKSIACLAFENCIRLTSITLPCSIVEMGYRVFLNCTGLKSINVQSKDPLKLRIDSEVFYNVDKNCCILNVPFGSKKNYQQSDQWKEFKNIVENEIFLPSSTKIEIRNSNLEN